MGPLAVAAFLGAMTTLVYAGKTLDWRMAIKATLAGTITATVTGGMLVEVFGWNLMVGQAVSFWLGMIAYRVTPLVLKGSEQVATDAPNIVLDKLRGLWGHKSAGQAGDEETKP